MFLQKLILGEPLNTEKKEFIVFSICTNTGTALYEGMKNEVQSLKPQSVL